MQSIVRYIYSCLLFVFAPFYLIKLWRRGRKEPQYSQRIGERFGFYAEKKPLHQGQYIWVHAVSLGETRASSVLIHELRQCIPDMKLLLTHGTATGYEQGQMLLQEGDIQSWAPVDLPFATQRFFKHFQPKIGLLIETEVWPNILHTAGRHHTPMLLVNARLSEKSLTRALKVTTLLRPAYQALTAALAQSEEDARRLKIIGAPTIEVVGNMKYDMQPSPTLLRQGQQWHQTCQRKVVMAASTREGEEELLLQAWGDMLTQYHQQENHTEHTPVLLIVPRHPQRFDEVKKLISKFGFSISMRSNWSQTNIDPTGLKADVWLGDTLQEMALYYGLSDVVLLGGSFKAFGGQNLIEALSCGCPVIFGEYTYNFAQPSQLAKEFGVAIQCNNFTDALIQTEQWLNAPNTLEQLQQKSLTFIELHRGAAKKIAAYTAQLCTRKDNDNFPSH